MYGRRKLRTDPRATSMNDAVNAPIAVSLCRSENGTWWVWLSNCEDRHTVAVDLELLKQLKTMLQSAA